jgi:SAM-dependent methyltransferase
MPKINLMARYPKTIRDEFINRSLVPDFEIIKKAKEFGADYFDGPREMGLGGYHYDPRFFTNTVEDFARYYELSELSSILDIGCAKGFMLHDFMLKIPGMRVAGIDISEYCLQNAISTAAPFISLGCCSNLPFKDQSFDLSISIATIHNLPIKGVERALHEIVRVTKNNAFVKVNGYSTEAEKKRLYSWNLVAETILHQEEWLELFHKTGYVFDYDFFVP